MSFLAEAKTQVQTSGRPQTKLLEIERKLGKKEYKEFLSACHDPDITASAIARALHNRGVRVSINWVAKLIKGMANNDDK